MLKSRAAQGEKLHATLKNFFYFIYSVSYYSGQVTKKAKNYEIKKKKVKFKI
jgi:hypothetical protein